MFSYLVVSVWSGHAQCVAAHPHIDNTAEQCIAVLSPAHPPVQEDARQALK
jgi:hypothetical protein